MMVRYDPRLQMLFQSYKATGEEKITNSKNKLEP